MTRQLYTSQQPKTIPPLPALSEIWLARNLLKPTPQTYTSSNFIGTIKEGIDSYHNKS